MAGTVDPTKEAFAAFRAADRPGPIHMLNLVKLRAHAAYPDGRTRPGLRPMRLTGGRASRFSRVSEDRSSGAALRADADRSNGGALGPLLHRSVPERRRFRRHDPRSRLPRSGQAPAGGGGGFAAHPPRAGRGRGRLRLSRRADESHRNRLPVAAGPRLDPRHDQASAMDSSALSASYSSAYRWSTGSRPLPAFPASCPASNPRPITSISHTRSAR